MFSDLARRAWCIPPSQFDLDLMRHQAAPASPAEPGTSAFLIGLSVSQGSPSGVAVLQKVRPSHVAGPRPPATYTCCYLRRWLPPDTAYPVLLSDLAAMLQRPLVNCDLIVEAGPSIKPVVTMLRKNRLPARIRPVEVKTIAEDAYVGDAWKVGKGSLIETTRQVLQEERMTFDERMPPEV